MNIFHGQILTVQRCDQIHYLSVLCRGIVLHVLTLELDESFSAGYYAKLLLKETEVSLLKGGAACISIANCLESVVEDIKIGKILSEVNLSTPIGAIKTVMITEKLREMGLEKGYEVTALFKASEIALSAGSV